MTGVLTSDFFVQKYSYIQDHAGYGLSQREEVLLCNAFSHWPSPYPENPVYESLVHLFVFTYMYVYYVYMYIHIGIQIISCCAIDFELLYDMNCHLHVYPFTK